MPKELPILQTDRELVEQIEMDAVIIATPHYAHPEQVMMSLQKGIHVLCEKPAGVYTKQVRMMNEEAIKHKLVFGLFLNQRTNPLYQKMKEIVESKQYGQIRRVNWIITDWYRTDAYYNATSWRGTWEKDGGGVLLNQCRHKLDLLQWICGIPVVIDAKCHEGKWHDIEVEDDVTAYLEFSNGATGVFVASTGDAAGTNRFEVVMDNGKILCENGELRVYALDKTEREFNAASSEEFKQPTGHWSKVTVVGENTQHLGILQNFINTINGKEVLLAPGEEGMKRLMISNAMYLSSWKKQEVTLPVEEEEFLKRLSEKRGSVCADVIM